MKRSENWSSPIPCIGLGRHTTTSGEDGLVLHGSLVGESQLRIPKLEPGIMFSKRVSLVSVELEYQAEWCALKSHGIRVSVVLIRWSRERK